MATDQREWERFSALLKKKKLKLTYERKKLFEEIQRLRGHFDADSLYDTLKGKGYRIARDTVYRTLPLLLECGAIQKSVGNDRREHFERSGRKGHHDHMVCIRCGSVVEFSSRELELLQEDLCQKEGFRLVFHDHRLFGYCIHCRES